MSTARNYSVCGNSSTAASTTIVMGSVFVTAAPTTRPSIYDILIGSDATPADNATKLAFQRFTTSGTSTVITPQALDPADPAANALGSQIDTVGKTLTASAFLLHIGMNQRQFARWLANPGSELRIPATSGSGIGMVPTVNTANYNADFTFLYQE
jgi:hypothetical protein